MNPEPTANQPPTDISANAYRLARAIDRACQTPGAYAIMLNICTRKKWTITIAHTNTIQILDLDNLTNNNH